MLRNIVFGAMFFNALQKKRYNYDLPQRCDKKGMFLVRFYRNVAELLDFPKKSRIFAPFYA